MHYKEAKKQFMKELLKDNLQYGFKVQKPV